MSISLEYLGVLLTPEAILENIPAYKPMSAKIRMELPKVLDLRLNFMTVRSQLKTSQCVPFSITANVEYFTGKKRYFSPQFIYDNRELKNASGMSLYEALKIANQMGVPTEDVYEFNIDHGNQIPQAVKDEASKFKIGSDFYLIHNVNDVKHALTEGRAVIAAFPVFNNSTRFFIQNQGDSLIGYHCVTFVGYSETSFIIRNSWGTGWGSNGYSLGFKFDDWGKQFETWTFSSNGNYPDVNSVNQNNSKCKCIIL